MQVADLDELAHVSAPRARRPDRDHWSSLVAGLKRLESTPRRVRRGADIIAQGRRYDVVFLLAEGFALRYRIMTDGRRQALNVCVPGDTVGYPSCFFEAALYTVSTLSEALVYPVSFSSVAAIVRDHPRLALNLVWSMSRETAMLGEHLANVGCRSAHERLAHFLLEMATRLEEIGLSDGVAFDLPLTQANLADVLGLSAPHVNRMLRRLREAGLIAISGSRLRILDRATLATLADFDETYLTPDPPARAAARSDGAGGRDPRAAPPAGANPTPPAA